MLARTLCHFCCITSMALIGGVNCPKLIFGQFLMCEFYYASVLPFYSINLVLNYDFNRMLEHKQTLCSCVARILVHKCMWIETKMSKTLETCLKMPHQGHSGTGQHQSVSSESLDLPRTICSGDTANWAQSLPAGLSRGPTKNKGRTQTDSNGPGGGERLAS